jgi:hypothetical protein
MIQIVTIIAADKTIVTTMITATMTTFVPSSPFSPGTVIMKVNATDSDLGQNAQLLFYIDNVSPSNKNIFKLDANTGFIPVWKSRENTVGAGGTNVKVNCPLDPASKSYAVKVPTIGSFS